jgi:hypothetical protein
MIRRAKAVWHGTGRTGVVSLTTDSGVLRPREYECPLLGCAFNHHMSPVSP